MMFAESRRPLFLLIAFLLACFALAACSPSAMAGGMTGGTIGLLLLGMLLAGGLTTQAACTDDNSDNADMGKDMYVGPCLSPPLPEDMAQDMPDEDASKDMYVGPCLSPLPPDFGNEEMGGDDMEVGPCLSPLPPDMDKDMKDEPDIGPCLSPPLDMGSLSDDLVPQSLPGEQGLSPSPEKEREQLLAKLSDRLPADVLAKLGKHIDEA